MLDKKTLRALYVALALCLVIRVGWAIYWSDSDMPREAGANVRIGQCFADGKGFAIDQSLGEGDPTNGFHLTAYRNPIYPTFLGVIFATIGEDPIAVGVVQSIIDTLTCFLVFLFALQLLNRPKAALVAAWMYALYPPSIGSVAVPMPETLATFFTLVAAYLLIKAIGNEARAYTLAGAMMGVLILLRPAMLLFPLAVIIMLLAARHRTRGWLLNGTVYMCAAVLVITPWTIRNYRVFHTFIPIATQTGNALWGGTGPADGKCMPAWSFRVASVGAKPPQGVRAIIVNPDTYMKITELQDRLSVMKEPALDRTLILEATKEIKQQPGRYAFLAVKKLFRLWFSLWDDGRPTVWNYVMAVLNAALLGLAYCGYRRAKTDYRVKLVSVYMCAYVTIACVLTCCQARYSYPVMPLVMLLAASHVGRAFDGGSSRGRLVIDL